MLTREDIDRTLGEGFLPQPAILPLVDLVITAADVQRVARVQFAKPKVVLTVVPEGQNELMVKGGAL